MTSSNEDLKDKCVDLSDYNRHYFEPNLVQNTNTTLSTRRNGQIHITWKSKMAALEFRKNVNNSALNKDICTKFYGKMHDGHAQRWTRDQKSKPEVNSRNVIKWKKHKFVDLSDYNIYLNQIWYRAQIPHYQHAGMVNSHSLQIQDGGRRHLGFLGYVKRKMSITPDWIKISASNFTG